MRTILSAPAWPYANGPRHIGHVSGFALPCDMFSRYQRMAGNRVLMVSGTDEHGTPIQVQADTPSASAWTWIGVPCSSVPLTISTLLPAIRWYRLNMSHGRAKPET